MGNSDSSLMRAKKKEKYREVYNHAFEHRELLSSGANGATGRQLFIDWLQSSDEQTRRDSADISRREELYIEAQQQPKLQKWLDKWEWEEPLGSGASCFVRKARLKRNNHACAIKCMHTDNVSLGSVDKEMMENEVEVLKEIRHPNIVKLIDFFETEDFFFVVRGDSFTVRPFFIFILGNGISAPLLASFRYQQIQSIHCILINIIIVCGVCSRG